MPHSTGLTDIAFYPLSVSAGLINAVINFVHPQYAAWRSYVAGGVGPGVVSIRHADSLQTSPLEAGVNHYNSDNSDTVTALVAQGKAGLSYNFTQHLAIFGEYRYVYVGSTSFVFGSTVYDTHVATTSWSAKLGAQSHNLGLAGLRWVF